MRQRPLGRCPERRAHPPSRLPVGISWENHPPDSLNRLNALRAEKRGGGELPLVLEELTDCISVRHRQLEDACDHLSIALIYENKQWLATRVEPDQSGNFPETAFSLYGGQMFLRGNVFANDGKIRDGSHFFLQFNRLSFNFPKKACIF